MSTDSETVEVYVDEELFNEFKQVCKEHGVNPIMCLEDHLRYTIYTASWSGKANKAPKGILYDATSRFAMNSRCSNFNN